MSKVSFGTDSDNFNSKIVSGKIYFYCKITISSSNKCRIFLIRNYLPHQMAKPAICKRNPYFPSLLN